MYKKIKSALLYSLLLTALAACAGGSNKRIPGSEIQQTKKDKAMIHTQLARSYMEKKQYSTAKKSLEKALSANPKHSDSNYVMGLLMIQLGQYKDAEKYLERAVKYNRENSAAAHDYGMLLCQVDKEKRAVTYFEIAASNPLFDRAELSYMRAGECLSRINDPRAEEFLKKALSVNPRLRPALYRLAIIKRAGGNNLSARAYIERYLAITKPQPADLLLAYQIESSLGAADVAENYRKRLLESFPGSSEAGQLRSVRDKN